jgi:hypothetical protein
MAPTSWQVSYARLEYIHHEILITFYLLNTTFMTLHKDHLCLIACSQKYYIFLRNKFSWFGVSKYPQQVSYPCWQVSHHKILINFYLIILFTQLCRREATSFMDFSSPNITRFGDGGAVRPQKKVVYLYEQKVYQHYFCISPLKRHFRDLEDGTKTPVSHQL